MRVLPLAVALCIATAACEGDNDFPHPSTEGQVRALYRVSRGDTADRAHIRYRLPGGNHVETDVTLPWESKPLVFDADETLWLTASAPENGLVSLQCDAVTDQGPYGRTSGSSGPASCRVDTSLEDLGRR